MTQEDQEPLRWGVVGTGVISRQMVADFALVPGATVSAVVSRDAARAAAFAEEFGIAESYSRRHDMFASDIDAVYIATPHVTHFDIASEAIAAGKHVLCEKPLGMNEREVRELAARAADAGVFLMEAMWMKFNPLYARLAAAHRRRSAGRCAQRPGRVRCRLPARRQQPMDAGRQHPARPGHLPRHARPHAAGHARDGVRARDRARGRRRPARGLHARLRGCALRARRQLDGRVDRSVSGRSAAPTPT